MHINPEIPALDVDTIDRYLKETERLYGVLDERLAGHEYVAGEYSIADMAIMPWYGALAKGLLYEAGEFLSVHEYTNVIRWTDQLMQRPAVQRGRMVNRVWGEPSSQLPERHDASERNFGLAIRLDLCVAAILHVRAGKFADCPS